MKVKVLKSFAGNHNGQKFHCNEGDILEIPLGADWVRAGLAVLVEGEAAAIGRGIAQGVKDAVAPETAAFEPDEAAVPSAPRKRKPKA